jgi:hypothetical protein
MSDSAKPVPSPFQKLREVTQKILAVPKAEIDRREQEWRKAKDAKKSKSDARKGL